MLLFTQKNMKRTITENQHKLWIAILTNIRNDEVEDAKYNIDTYNENYGKLQFKMYDSCIGTDCAQAHNLELLKYVHSKGFKMSSNVLLVAIMSRDKDMIKYCIENDFPMSEQTTESLALKNMFDLLKLAREHGCPWNDSVTQYAARNNFEMLKWAFENGCPMHESACDEAASVSNFKCFVYAHEHGSEISSYTIKTVIQEVDMQNILKFIEYIVTLGYSLQELEDDFQMTYHISRKEYNGHGPLKWVHEQGIRFCEEVCDHAICSDNFEMLKWLDELGYTMDKNNACEYAVQNDNFEMFKWLHEKGCIITQSACETAVELYGNFDIFMYCINNECKVTLDIAQSASIHSDTLEIFKYCFVHYKDPQKFWNCQNFSGNFDAIDLDDPVWRKLFDLDLYHYPLLAQRVKQKKLEIEQISQKLLEVFQDDNKLPNDVIKYCILPLI